MLSQLNQSQTPTVTVSEAAPDILKACKLVKYFDDDRDRVLLRLNCYLASIGIGKSFYEPGKWVLFTKNNVFQIFKGICYSQVDLRKPIEGEVTVLFNRPAEQIRDRVEVELANIIVANTGSTLHVLSVYEVSPTTTLVNLICRSQGRILSTSEVLQRLRETPPITSQLKNLGVFDCFKSPGITEADVAAFNARPVEGFTSQQLKSAYDQNPRKSKMTLTSILSPAELSRRSFLQKKCIEQNCKRIESIENRVKNINRSLYTSNSSVISLMERSDKLSSRLSQIVSRLSVRDPPDDVFRKIRQSYQFATNYSSFQGPIDSIKATISNSSLPDLIPGSDSTLADSLSLQLIKMEELVEQANRVSQRVVEMEMAAVGGVAETSQNNRFYNR